MNSCALKENGSKQDMLSSLALTVHVRFGMILFACLPGLGAAVPSLSVYPNFHTVGVMVTLDSPADADSVEIAYGSTSEGGLQPGFSLSKVHGVQQARFAGALFNVVPGKSYEVVATLTGGNLDGLELGPVLATTRYKSEVIPPPLSSTLYVSPTGTDTVCSEAFPCALETGLESALPGTEVVLRGGLYRAGRITLDNAGFTRDAPLIIRGYEDEEAVIDGGIIPDWNSWSPAGSGVYHTTYDPTEINGDGNDAPLDRNSLLVLNEKRLFPYQSLDCLESLSADITSAPQTACTGPNTVEVGYSGFFATENNLFVHLTNDSQPLPASIVVSRYAYGFRVRQGHTFFNNLHFRHYGRTHRAKALRLDPDANHTVVQNNVFLLNDIGVGIGTASDHNVIERNEFADSPVADWPWAVVKYAAPSELEGGGIFFEGNDLSLARGNVIRSNIFHGFFDGAAVCPFIADFSLTTETNETDIYDNTFYSIGDDGIQADGFCSNVRLWNNTLYNSYVGISMAPSNGGPIYLIRNLLYSLRTRTFFSPDRQDWKYGAPIKLTHDRQHEGGEMFLFHNTVDASESCDRPDLRCHNGLTIFEDEGWASLLARNNIWMGSDRAIAKSGNYSSNIDLDCDNLYRTSSNEMIYWNGTEYPLLEFQQAESQELQGSAFYPDFVDPGIGDYRLLEQSPIIDRGCVIPGINTGFSGDAPDIGYSEFPLEPVLDIDDNGLVDALTDGILLIRYLFGFGGNILTDGAVDTNGNRVTPIEVEAYLAQQEATGILDIDLNSQSDSLSDGVLVARYLFGFRGQTLVERAADPNGGRSTASAIESYISELVR
jgi:hypothetical protein